MNVAYFSTCELKIRLPFQLLHANSGVEKGVAGPGRKPLEIMGLMVGRPDVEQAGSLIVTDVCGL